MLFASIMSFIVFLLLLGFTITNKRKYNKWKVPGTFAAIMLIISIVFAIQVPASLKQHTQTKNVSNRPSMATKIKLDDGGLKDAKQSEAQQELALDRITDQLNKVYEKIGTVSFDKNTRTFSLSLLSGSNTAQAVQALEEDHSLADQIKWPDFVSSIRKTSAQLSDALGDGYTFQVMGVTNPNTPIYAAKDGKDVINIAQ